jgi:hypothetical protein
MAGIVKGLFCSRPPRGACPPPSSWLLGKRSPPTNAHPEDQENHEEEQRTPAYPTGMAPFMFEMSAAPVGGAAAAADLRPAIPRLSWTACDGGFACATAEVPLDYNQPTGAKVGLALVRCRPAPRPAESARCSSIRAGRPGGAVAEHRWVINRAGIGEFGWLSSRWS